MAVDHVAKHWPELVALRRTLEELTNASIAVAVPAAAGDLAAQGRQIRLALDAYDRRSGR